MEHQKLDIFKELLDRGARGTSWRGFDEKLDEVVCFGGPGLRHMIMAIIAKSQDKPDTLYVFYFEPSPSKQETEVKDLKSAKQQKGAGGFFKHIFDAMKGSTALNKIVIKVTREEAEENEERARVRAADAHAKATSVEALDAQCASLKLNEGDDDGPSTADLDAFL
jgi:hypothetical protein